LAPSLLRLCLLAVAVQANLPSRGNLLDAQTLERDLVDLFEQRVSVRSASGNKEGVDFFGGCRSLELLAVKQLLFELLE